MLRDTNAPARLDEDNSQQIINQTQDELNLLSQCSLRIFQIHWFSIFNSFMMVIFLVGLVSMILMRTLRKDYARYSKEDDLDEMVGSTDVSIILM